MKTPKTRILSAETLHRERERLPLWVPVLLGVGIGVYFLLPDEPALWQPMRALLLLACMFLLARRRFVLRVVVLAALLIALGFALATWRSERVAAPIYQEGARHYWVEATLENKQPREKAERWLLSELAIEGMDEAHTPRKINVTLKNPASDIEIGDRLRLGVVLFPPPGPAMPGGYDFARGYYFQQVGASGFAPQAPQLVEKAVHHPLWQSLNRLRFDIAQRIAAAMPAQTGPIAVALMVGEQGGVSDADNEALRGAGLYHILSISGLHLSIAVGLLYVSLRLVLALWPPLAMRLPAKKIAAGLGLVGGFVYLALAGFPVPAIRSFIMVASVMLAVMLDRKGITLYALAWAATLILLWQPEALVGASFQLSFAATVAIVVCYELWGKYFTRRELWLPRRLLLYFTGLMLTSLAATFATAPLVVYHFNRFTLWGVLVNMLVIPLASLWIMPAAALAFLLMPLGFEGWPLLWLSHGIELMMGGARLVAALPQGQFSLPSPTGWGMALAVAGGLWFAIWKTRWRWWGMPLVLLGFASSALTTPYDMLISGDGKRVAVRLQDDSLLFLRGKPESFDAGVWLRAQGLDETHGHAASKNTPLPENIHCSAALCRGELHGFRFAVLRRKDASALLCEQDPDIVITPGLLADSQCLGAPLRIDARFLAGAGAVGLRLRERVEIDTAQAYRGRRPWSRPEHEGSTPGDE